MQKRVLITVGGTGGHVYPALSLAQQLKSCHPSLDILFAGGNLVANRYFEHGSFPYSSIACGSFTKKNPLSILKSCFSIAKGFWQSKRILKKFKPDLVIGFGSYYTLPALLAAKFGKFPFVLHEANSIPGKVNRLMSPYAILTGIHFPATASFLNGKTVEVGMPLREGYKQGLNSHAMARSYFQLEASSSKITLLIFGGSQGAQTLNKLAAIALTQSHFRERLQVIHLTGSKEKVEYFSQLYRQNGIAACVKDFETRMDLAWQAADLVISRAGAGTIAEEMEFEVPGILIPYPFATDRHQDHNAQFMVQTVGGAEMVQEKALSVGILQSLLSDYLENDSSKLKKMKEAIKSYKENARQTGFSDLIIQLLKLYY